MSEVDVVIDMRESRSDMFELFDSHPDVASVETEMLEVGDIIANGEIAFERKSQGDFVSSIKNRRLENQIEAMYDLFGPQKSYVVVETNYEDFEYLPYSQFTSKSVYGYIGSISARWQMVPLFTSTPEHLVDAVTRIARKHSEDTDRVVREPIKSPSTKSSDFFERTVLQFSGVGKSKIDPLRDEFGSVAELSEATESRLTKIDGIGSSTAESIIEELHSDD